MSKEQSPENKKECKCTGPWDCQCEDVQDEFYNESPSPERVQPDNLQQIEIWRMIFDRAEHEYHFKSSSGNEKIHCIWEMASTYRIERNEGDVIIGTEFKVFKERVQPETKPDFEKMADKVYDLTTWPGNVARGGLQLQHQGYQKGYSDCYNSHVLPLQEENKQHLSMIFNQQSRIAELESLLQIERDYHRNSKDVKF